MNCEDATKLMYAGVDEPLTPGDGKTLTEHLRGCEKCRTESRKLKHLEEILRSMPEPPVSRARLGETVGAVSLEIRGRGRAGALYHRIGVWAAVAAAVVVAAGVGLLAGRRRATPTEETPAPGPVEVVARESRFSAVPEGISSEVAIGLEDNSPQQSDLLVEKLVQADLALSEAEGPGHKAVIFCGMSRDVLSALEESVDRSDVEEVRALGQGYTKLVREGVLPNVKLASGDEARQRVSQVTDSLKGNREVLGVLVARVDGSERTLLAEALDISEECLSAARDKLGLF